ncbi:MAG: hypothetical protein K2W82_10230 [Candidatus Obscuribacterales bacterium]|nr:hypothetical protein [Candidatus Obscuribacterales bacterium]
MKFWPLLAILILAQPALAETPTEAYKELHKKELSATCYEDLVKLRSSRSVAKDPPQTPEEAKQFFTLLQFIMPKTVTVTGEEINGDEATVHAVAPPGLGEDPATKTIGIIKLFKEKDGWKIDHEKWDSKVEKKD